MRLEILELDDFLEFANDPFARDLDKSTLATIFLARTIADGINKLAEAIKENTNGKKEENR